MRSISIIAIIITFSVISFGQTGNMPGRYLPGDIWQPQNLNSTNAALISNSENPFDIFTDWGTDIRLTHFDLPHAHWPEIAASGNYLNVAWWYLTGDSVYLARSSDGGLTWTDRKLSDDSTMFSYVPQISASDSNVYVVYRGARPWEGIYMRRSTDYGATWYNTQRLYYTARNYAVSPTVASFGNRVYVTADIEVDYVPPQDWDIWLFRSNDCGRSWPDTFFVSDSTSSSLGPDLAINNSGLHLIRGFDLISSNATEIVYSGSSDGGETWFGPTMLSDNDSLHSFWPQIAAWADSNVIVSWTDYKYSHFEWTGDALISKSTNNGRSWTAPYQLTFSHGVKGTDILLLMIRFSLF